MYSFVSKMRWHATTQLENMPRLLFISYEIESIFNQYTVNAGIEDE